MRLVILSLSLSISVALSAQYDTSLIAKTFDYIKTEDFKTALKNYTEAEISNLIATYPNIRKRAGRFRKEERARMNFWITNPCLVPEQFYLIPDTNGKFGTYDSLVYVRLAKYDFGTPTLNCANKILIAPVFLDKQTIQLEHFSGRMPFGESNTIKLRFTDGHFEFISRGGVIYN